MVQRLIMRRSIHIHFLSLDGTLYGTPPSGRITYEYLSRSLFVVSQLAVTRSRVMGLLLAWDETNTRTERVKVLVVWDVKTGDLVSSL
jgi:hypothetical protein